MNLQSTITLNNGVEMPRFGLGVYKVESGNEVEHAVKEALNVGYTHIDTAAFYDNEKGVGRMIKEANKEIFVTTKVWNDDQGYDATLRAFEKSQKNLGVDVIDLYLIHWPVKGKFVDTWKAMEKLYEEGQVRAIGVSNFLERELDELAQHSSTIPAVNQVEYHPWLQQHSLYDYCKHQGIQLEAWSPLTRGRKLDDETLLEIAKKHNKSAAQIILRWNVQKDVITIPKSVTPERIKENANIFDFELDADDMVTLATLDEGLRFGSHPKKFSE
ncbi:aldo/keto reductase [Paenalkalicoccus suaedae]|uniref:Aldo/keto reductase n=1 Tax=Paenalkalicoccus suaedae TaxID=2592382 RepID=A0A859FJC4_9BACI|nr:aldo/keto reductase [Paenalkalicoccus suaedae]QKS72866.1 aldo/keto reductase [Paenalkalicoccus suaedae]